MTSDVRQLIDQTIELTGATPPTLLDADAPVLGPSSSGEIYLIGLVGGKDVGKSSLVNALVGKPITASTSHGPGTETVIAYAHQHAINGLRELLEREVPGRYTIIMHTVEKLRRQVLLDLPDIDSKYDDHIQITRRMLRHMLYPIWIQSVEKYADRRPQELLSAVAEGNDPANFVFVLNKADQLSSRDGAGAAEQLRADYAKRVAQAIQLDRPPAVFLISATRPDDFDLPRLSSLLAQEKSTHTVEQSRTLADRRQDRSLFGWFERQRLGDRAVQIAAIQRDAEELVGSRVAMPILERAIPRMLDDPGQRMALIVPATQLRLSRWPIVNAIDALLSPVLALVQKNLSAAGSASLDPDAFLVDSSGVSTSIQTTFAQLQQLHPQLSEIYRDGKPWESMNADLLAADLRRRFSAALQRQREQVLEQAAGRFHAVFAPVRWLLTIGAVLWFPIVQPILFVMLQQNMWTFSRELLLTVVTVLSVQHLLTCTTFLLLWFLILWVLLRWSTQRRINAWIQSAKLADAEDEWTLGRQTIQWANEMVEPIRRRRERIDSVLKQAEELRRRLTETPAAPVRVPAVPARGLA